MKRTVSFSVIVLAVLVAAAVLWRAETENSGVPQRYAATASPLHQDPVPPQFTDKSLFLTPIKLSKTVPSSKLVTGITVPHHLLATDIMANAYKFASSGSYSQVVLFSPDHFTLGQTDVSISENDFSTVFGTLQADTQEVKNLETLPFVKSQNFFYREHGIGAELPFIKYYFPNVKVVAMTFKESMPRAELVQVVDVLEKTIGKNTLVVQSTDFSHYLTPGSAELHDEQTIKVLQAGDPEQLFSLEQPENIDSIASQYVQSRLQRDFFGSSMSILAHKNSQDYTSQKVDSTTSYVVQAYEQPAPQQPTAPGVSMVAVGDIMLSRSVGELISRYGSGYPFANIGSYLKSADFVFANLETPISPGLPVQAGSMSFRADPVSVAGLKNAGVSLLSIANNHVPNAGPQGILDTVSYLDQAGIGHAGAGANEQAAEAPYLFQKNGIRFALLAYNDSDVVPPSYSAGQNSAGTNFMDAAKVARNVVAAKLLADVVIVSMHAGHEYHDLPDADQVNFAHAAVDAGADLVVGTHPHVVQPVEVYRGKYIFYSLGNFIFDQGFSYQVTHGMTVVVHFSKAGVESVDYNPVVIKKFSQPELDGDAADAEKVKEQLRLDGAKNPEWKPEE